MGFFRATALFIARKTIWLLKAHCFKIKKINQEPQCERIKMKRTLGGFFKLFLPSTAFVLMGMFFLVQSEKRIFHTEAAAFDAARAEIGAGIVERNLKALSKDALILANDHVLRRISAKDDAEGKKALVDNWTTFSRTKGLYDQVRWIDRDGLERIRINFNDGAPKTVPEALLQNKQKRYYFEKAVNLHKGEIYISPLDLNVEHGKIEMPIKPTIRFSTPVYDFAERPRGVIVLNYFAHNLLDEMARDTSLNRQHAWLVDEKGYFAKGPSEDLEWGSMYGRKQATMAARHPEAWSRISSEESGQVRLADGLWTFRTVRMAAHDSLELKVIVHLPDTAFQKAQSEALLKYGLIALVILTAMAFALWRLVSSWVREIRLKEEARKLSMAVEGSTNIVFISGTDGKISYFNERFQSLTGYERDDILDRHVRLLKSPTTPNAVFTDMNETVRRGDTWRGEIEVGKKNGYFFWAEVSVIPVRDGKGGAISQYLAILEDISQKHEAAQAIKRAERLADAARQTKAAIISNMSHELRTPLNGVIGLAEILQDTPLKPQEQFEFGERILSSANHLQETLDGILEIADLEAGEVSINVAEVDISDILKTAFNELEPTAASKGIDFSLATDSSLSNIFSDAAKIKKIVHNLLSNAIKFTPQGKSIILQSQGVPDENAFKIIVSDSGVGMDDREIEKAFQPFRKMEVPRNGETDGAGIGLAVTLGLADALGGSVDLSSKPGKGTIATVTLPMEAPQGVITA